MTPSRALGSSVVMLMCVGACLGPAPGPPGRTIEHESSHFTFHYAPSDREIVAPVVPLIEAEYPRIVADLDADGIRRVQVFFYETHADLAAAVEPIVGPIPTWATGLVTSAERIHIQTPRGLTDARVAKVVIHEFAHCATLHVNPAIANNPRWLWETAALFEAGESVDPRGLPYIATGPYPTLSDLNVISDRKIYDVGYLIGEFVVNRWGYAGLRALIRWSGHLESALGIATRDFESDWIAFVRARYGM